MLYNGTATAPASILSVSNLVGSDSVTLSGSAALAGAAVGAEAITSFSGLTLGGMAAPNYTLAGASGIVTILSTNAVTPIFSGLTSHTNTSGPTVALTGKVSASGTYPPSGTVITVSINGSPQSTNIYDSTGDFAINYNTLGLPASATPYTVTYTSAAAVGFNAATDTSTTLTITAGGGATADLIGTFNSVADTTLWVNAGQVVTVTPSFVADAPPGQALSTGSLGWTGTYDSSGHTFGGLQTTFSSTNLVAAGYTDFQFDVKVLNNSFDQNGQIQSLQPVLGITSSLNWSQSSVQPQLVNVTNNNGWQHIDIPLTAFPGSLTDVRRVILLMYDGNYVTPTSVQLAFDNIMFTAPGVANVALTPVFSGLTSHTNASGAPVALTGKVSTNGASPASGTVITVTINGNAQTTTLSDSTGDFSINYNTTGLSASVTPYTVTYASPGGGGFNAATNANTTLTIVAQPQISGISVNPDGTQFIFNYPTVSGQTYQLEYTTDLTSGLWLPVGSSVPGTGAPVSVTNSISSSMQMFFRLSITP